MRRPEHGVSIGLLGNGVPGIGDAFFNSAACEGECRVGGGELHNDACDDGFGVEAVFISVKKTYGDVEYLRFGVDGLFMGGRDGA
mgnify:CR=1 FL=1